MMLSTARSIKQLILVIMCLGLLLKYLEVRSAGGGGRYETETQIQTSKTIYQEQSNVTNLARIAEKFPPKIRDYFLDTERPFLRKEGKERFFEYFEKTYPEADGTLRDQMRLLNESWHQRLPSAIIIGCKKCGTTFLKDVLIRHPFVAMAETENGHFIMREKYEQGPSFYRSEMAYSLPDQITMEKSPLYWPVTAAPKRIYEFNPRIKLILAVRDPACRIASDFFFGQKVVGYVNANVTFQEVMVRDEHSKLRDFLGAPSRYGPIMERWLQYFSLDNFMVIRNEDMLTGRGVAKVLAQLEDFLGIPHGVRVEERAGGEVCVTQPVPQRNFCFRATPQEDMPCQYYRLYPDIMAGLKQQYMPDVHHFQQLLQRDFHW